jgi:hypothetical protein
MKVYTVEFTAKVDCAMDVCLEDDETPSSGVLFEAIVDRFYRNTQVDDWVEEGQPTIDIIDYKELY